MKNIYVEMKIISLISKRTTVTRYPLYELINPFFYSITKYSLLTSEKLLRFTITFNMKLLIFAVFISSVYGTCRVSPAHWCDTVEIARRCGVETICRNFLQAQATAEPVNVTLYYESLCPYCRQFITEQLHPTWKTFQSTGIMMVDIIPYGNAQEVEISTGYYNYTCQHGPSECTGNLIENCILKYKKYDADAYLPIIYCMEKANDPIAAAEKCVTDAMMDWKVIDTCAKGKEGNSLMHEAAVLTGKLNPPHKYVPWIVINGMHTEGMQQQAQSDLAKVLCDTYTGEKPEECNHVHNNIHLK